MSVSLVFDTGALIAYVDRSDLQVAGMLAAAAEHDHMIVVPSPCLVEAYAEVSPEGALLLDVLRSLPVVTIPALAANDVGIVGGMARQMERLGLAHAVIEAITHRVILVTADGLSAARLLEDWQIWDVAQKP